MNDEHDPFDMDRLDDDVQPSRARSLGEILASVEAKLRPFWTCPTTGQDCRFQPAPALAILRPGKPNVRFQMYATADLAGMETFATIECEPGMTAFYILDSWQHYASKTWMEPHAAEFNDVMSRLMWHFGDRSWSFCAGAGPKAIGKGWTRIAGPAGSKVEAPNA
ncbi:hypothetical protein [Azospirillum argentinense]|uniref:hypothetical protein n=1 Tax=Azospirillum argentinense TaxID=2970906 RepID=UPI0032DE74E8